MYLTSPLLMTVLLCCSLSEQIQHSSYTHSEGFIVQLALIALIIAL